MATGVNISKAVAYAVVSEKRAVNISKAVGFAVITTKPGITFSKAVSYAVIQAINSNPPNWPGVGFSKGVLNNPYSASLDLAPAATPLTFTQTVGVLPTGLTLSSSGTTITLSGTPTLAGSFTFGISASNVYGSQSNLFTVLITTPTGGGGGENGGAWVFVA